MGFNKDLRYTEGNIELNDAIEVKGIARWKVLKKVITGYSYSKILTLEGAKKEKLLITDEPKALLPVKDRF